MFNAWRGHDGAVIISCRNQMRSRHDEREFIDDAQTWSRVQTALQVEERILIGSNKQVVFLERRRIKLKWTFYLGPRYQKKK